GSNYQQMQTEWKTYYIYGRVYTKHRNGVVGTSALKIAVENLEEARKQFKKMGFAELKKNPTKNTARFKLVRNQELHLVAPTSPEDNVSNFLKTRGSGVFAITFEVENLDSTKAFLTKSLPTEALLIDSLHGRLTIPQEHAYGVQLEFVQEPEEQALLVKQLAIGSALDSIATKHAAGL